MLPSRFSRVRPCATPWTAAYQASPSMGFSRQEHWSGLPFPSPKHQSEKWKWSCSVVRLSDPTDCSLPGSSVHGVFQARVLEWGAIAFSDVHLLIRNNSEVLVTSLRSVRRCLRWLSMLPISIPGWPPGVVSGTAESAFVLLLPGAVVKLSEVLGVPDTTRKKHYFHCCRTLHITPL